MLEYARFRGWLASIVIKKMQQVKVFFALSPLSGCVL